MRLVGNRRIKLDAKGRLVFPADFKKAILAELKKENNDDSDAPNVLYLYPSTDALFGFTPAGHQEWVDKHFTANGKEYDPNDVDDEDKKLDFYSMTTSLEMDAAGRIALTKIDKNDPFAREELGIEGEVVLAGAGSRFEIWSVDRWEKRQAAKRGARAASRARS